ncbi:aminoglycoside phosphotransferase family protein [Quadrisphaera sp. KR29]|uniref:aminoglycoside phosphotransferase family protein n=1 Tax=Quadrisphaera sp. KR29 TaxID=3461391 RepID=UPI004043FEAC
MGLLLHRDQVPTDVALVRALLADQLPHLADQRVEPVPSSGTDHDVYRLGDHLAVRLPKIAWAREQGASEAFWLPRLAPHLPLALPRTEALGRPACGYPFGWAVVAWLPGRQADPAVDGTEHAAEDLAAFVLALRALPPSLGSSEDDDDGGRPAPVRGPGRRGGPLGALDGDVRTALAELGDRADVVVEGGARAVLRCWDAALQAPPHAGRPVWAHGDLLPGNLLVDAPAGPARPGRLTAVIDWGALALADPAVDLLPAWHLFGGPRRRGAQHAYRERLGADDAAWARGRGTVVHQAVQALPYYWDTNPGMVAQASRALAAAVAETA